MTGMLKTAAVAAFSLMSAGMLAACGTAGRTAYVAPSEGVTEVRTESLLEADRAFAARAQDVGPAAAFADFMAEDGKLLGAADDPVEGTAAIFAVMVALPENAEMSWTPLEAIVSDSGEMGVTWGEYRLSAPGEGGAVIEESGRYLTVWRKDEQGRWRGVLDIGT